VHRREQCIARKFRLIVAAKDDGVVTHRTPYESTLPGPRRRRTLAHHNEQLTVVLFLPRKIVVVVHEVLLLAAHERHDLSRDPLAPSVRVIPRELHQVPVVVSDGRVE
jgi:hypothetical protein